MLRAKDVAADAADDLEDRLGLRADRAELDEVVELQPLALQSHDLVRAMEKDTGEKLPSLRVDGGATANHYLMQFQSDILNCPVERPQNADTTALGVAYLAGMEAGIWKNVDDLLKLQEDRTIFRPAMHAERRDRELRYWNKGVERVKNWSE